MPNEPGFIQWQVALPGGFSTNRHVCNAACRAIISSLHVLASLVEGWRLHIKLYHLQSHTDCTPAFPTLPYPSAMLPTLLPWHQLPSQLADRVVLEVRLCLGLLKHNPQPPVLQPQLQQSTWVCWANRSAEAPGLTCARAVVLPVPTLRQLLQQSSVGAWLLSELHPASCLLQHPHCQHAQVAGTATMQLHVAALLLASTTHTAAAISGGSVHLMLTARASRSRGRAAAAALAAPVPPSLLDPGTCTGQHTCVINTHTCCRHPGQQFNAQLHCISRL